MIARRSVLATGMILAATGLLAGTAAGVPTPPVSTPPAAPAAAPVGPAPTEPPLAPIDGPLAPLVYNGPREKPVIALTIDDCFDKAVLLRILGILQEQRVNATFFPIGRIAQANADALRQVAAAGFPVANHTWSHSDMTVRTWREIVDDIWRDDQEVSAVIGQPLMKVVRPYGGKWNETLQSAAAAVGYQAVVIWDTTFGDTGGRDVPQLVLNGTRGINGSIVLMHANNSWSAEALPLVIASYRARGFSFVTLGELLGVPGPVPYPPFPDATPTPSPSPTPTATPTPSPTPRPTPSPTPRPTPEATPSPHETPSPAPEPGSAPGPSWVDIYGATAMFGLGVMLVVGAGVVRQRRRR